MFQVVGMFLYQGHVSFQGNVSIQGFCSFHDLLFVSRSSNGLMFLCLYVSLFPSIQKTFIQKLNCLFIALCVSCVF
jgi:hypothetical protein